METTERYRLIDEAHGEGAFGKIQKFQDVQLERIVAIKGLKLLDDPDAKERFIREAKTLAKMSHPNVPAIYDVKFFESEMQILFEFVEGQNLRKTITDKTIPTIKQVRRWFVQIALALDHAHGIGIVHRDVKPENIIISSDQMTAVLVDFGIALTQDDVQQLTSTGYVIGTPAYMSPEQVEGKELDGRTDVYSLGLTLYETLSGHLPSPGDYRELSEENEAIPPAVDELVRKCIHHDRDRRLADVKEFITDLSQSIRTDVPLSSVLTDARLHEISAALNQLSAEDFHAKPKGQRLLILQRLKGLLRTDKLELQLATAQLIELLVKLAVFESETDYEEVVEAAFIWGFDRAYGESWQGNQEIRDTLIFAAKQAGQSAHAVLSAQFIKCLTDKSLSDLPGWYRYDLRKIVSGLLANPACVDRAAENLAKGYELVDQVSK
ncbi:MAG: hypothetical protein CEE38_23430 [Planctomycetes bacterium B3_Pla]|nr:MAG: hypothetical protein CEE38_23430 [Planctomycetes bacterium B3_Pla]